MRPRQLLPALLTVPTILVVFLGLVTEVRAAPKYRVLHAFGKGNDGAGLWAGLVFDRHGNLYGTTSGGGAYGYGTVFQLRPGAGGKRTERLLHSFRNNDPHGDDLNGGLVFDAAGNLYGTATLGGGPYKYGTVFELTPGSGGWTLTVLHRFGFNSRGCCPSAGVVMDNAGDLFGTASVAFELSPGADGWKETVLHRFSGTHDGYDPFAGLIMDATGNLYGTTQKGGAHHVGVVYRLSHTASGWKEEVLHNFLAFSSDGQVPGTGALILDSAGNLYGTTSQGGSYTCGDIGCGTVFKLTRQVSGDWKETILYNFAGGSSGSGPGTGVVFDQAGNLYGTTIYGGTQWSCGVVYKLAPQTNGKWEYTVLHRFTGADGAQPAANLILDDKGNLYGTTVTGGTGGYGVAFELTP